MICEWKLIHSLICCSVVDMRWGIRDKAVNDHKAAEICLSEIDKCLNTSLPGAPNFLFLASNRYGSLTLPAVLQNLDKILRHVKVIYIKGNFNWLRMIFII